MNTLKRKTIMQENLEKLTEKDIYSILFIALYKLNDIREYSNINSLITVLDKENFFKLIKTLGGQTIKIPTVEEIMTIVNALLVYQNVNIEGQDMKKAFDFLALSPDEIIKVKEAYLVLCEVLKGFNFNGK